MEQSKKSFSKIKLEKNGDKISLEKSNQAAGYGQIECNLNWGAGSQEKKIFGLFKNKKSSEHLDVDLDLGCLYEMSDGSKSAIQALGNCFGSFDKFPYINLSGDDRSGTSTDGEFLYINGNYFNEIKRVCVFAYIYEGAINWEEAKAKVTVKVPEQPVIEVILDTNQNKLSMCAIVMLENVKGKLKVTKLNKYFQNHSDLDKNYKWGMNWVSGSK